MKKFNSKISVSAPCNAMTALYAALEREETPYSAYVHQADKGVRLVTIYADAKDIPHFKEVLNKHQL